MTARVVNLRDFRHRSGPLTITQLPSDVVRVDRRTAWGNPYVIGTWDPTDRYPTRLTRATAIDLFRRYAITRLVGEPDWLVPLEGKRLACWCAPERCHAEVLIELEELVTALGRVIRTGGSIRSWWLSTPAAIFDGLAPRDVVAAGRTAEVVAELNAVADDVFA